MQPGHRLSGRYELEEALETDAGGVLWRALDTVLGRGVAVRVASESVAADPEAARVFRSRATTAAGLEHRHTVTVFDVAAEDGRPYVVTELAEGPSLDRLLGDGALAPQVVATIGRDVADALAAAHADGLVHGGLTAADVLVAPTGEAKLADLAEPHRRAAPEDDVRALSQLLSRALAPGARGDLPAPLARALADGNGDGPTGVGAGQLARELSPLVDDGAREQLAGLTRGGRPAAGGAPAAPPTEPVPTGPPTTRVEDTSVIPPSAGDTGELSPPPTRPGPAPPGTPDADRSGAGGSGRPGRARRAVVALALLAVVVVGAVLVSGALDGGGSQPGGDPTAGGGAPPVSITGASDFDPAGDGTEHADEVDRAVDGDPATAWTSEHYETPPLGGLKSGVGLWVRLSEAADPSAIQLRLPGGTVDVQVHLADEPPAGTDPAAWGTQVASLTDASGEVTVPAPGQATGRVVVLWFTRLGAADGRYQARVAEVSVSR